MSNFYDNIKNQYPYGEFPSQYTINGQNEMRAKLNTPVSTQEVPEQPTQTQQTGMNLESIMPLLLGSLTGEKKLDQKTLIKQLLPANSSIPPQLIDLMLRGKVKKNDTSKVSSSSTNVIDTYKRIDQ